REFGFIFANHQGIAPIHLDLTPVDKIFKEFLQ
ncbi:MAG: hypothetical protein QG605_1475, partial [Euryarchaeota archaeon]|nr:hypothetical protein [Euryarchaeota archaeon]